MRRIAVAIITAVALVVGVAPSAHAAKKFSVTIAVSKSSISLGSTLTISGKVSPKAVGQTVTIQKKLAGGKWKTEKKVKISSSGTYSYTDKPKTTSTRKYRTYKPKKGKIKKGYSKVVTVKVTKAVQQAASLSITSTGPTTIDAGQQVMISGKSSASLKGKAIQLQRLDGTTWKTLATGTVASSATWTLKTKATQAGAAQQFRVAAPATATTKAASTPARAFKVYGWYYLADLDKVESVRFSSGSVSIAGTVYSKSVRNASDFWWNAAPYGEWGLNYKCTQLRATVGLGDTSLSGSQVGFVAKVDSLESSLATLGNGQAQAVSVDLTGGYRLRLEDRWVAGPRSSGPASIIGAWGNAQVRCAL